MAAVGRVTVSERRSIAGSCVWGIRELLGIIPKCNGLESSPVAPSLPRAGKVEEEGVLAGGLFQPLEATGPAAVARFHVDVEDHWIGVRLPRTQPGDILGGLAVLHLRIPQS